MRIAERIPPKDMAVEHVILEPSARLRSPRSHVVPPLPRPVASRRPRRYTPDIVAVMCRGRAIALRAPLLMLAALAGIACSSSQPSTPQPSTPPPTQAGDGPSPTELRLVKIATAAEPVALAV